MPLTQHRFQIALDDLANEHEVVILPVDQLRAETEGNRRGLTEPKRQGTLVTLLWLWAASRRVGLVDKECKFEPFVERLVAWDTDRDEAGAPVEPVEVDPTSEAGSSTSASSSPPASPASTGFEPSSTILPSSLPPYGSSSPTPNEAP